MRVLLIAGMLIGPPLTAHADSGLEQFVLPQTQDEVRELLRGRYTFDLEKLQSGGNRYQQVEPPGVEPPRTDVPGISGAFPAMEAVDMKPYSIEPAGTERGDKAQIFLSEEECGTVALQSSGVNGGSGFGMLLARMVAACRSTFDASS